MALRHKFRNQEEEADIELKHLISLPESTSRNCVSFPQSTRLCCVKYLSSKRNMLPPENSGSLHCTQFCGYLGYFDLHMSMVLLAKWGVNDFRGLSDLATMRHHLLWQERRKGNIITKQMLHNVFAVYIPTWTTCRSVATSSEKTQLLRKQKLSVIKTCTSPLCRQSRPTTCSPRVRKSTVCR